MKVRIDLKMEVDFENGTHRFQVKDLWGNAQEFAEAACERATSSSKTNNPFVMFLSEMLDRASEASQRAQDSSVDPEERPNPG